MARDEPVSIALMLLRLVAAAVAALVVTLLGALLFPFVVGYRTSVVVTGSMEPNLSVGDAVVGHRINPASANVGDVVIFRDPGGSGRQITHRVIAVRRGTDVVAFTTKGDANSSVERFTVRANGYIGLVSYRVPQVGYVLVHFRGPIARILLVGVPAIVLLVLELRRIWRPEDLPGEPAAA